jgi:hypothetical protein
VAPRRLGFPAAYPALTLAFAIVAHVLAEALGSRSSLGGLLTPVHAALGSAALAALAWAAFALGLHRPAAERRRRLALIAAAVDRRSGFGRAVLDAGLQGAVAFGTLAIEGIRFEPGRLWLALGCALGALFFGALVLRTARRGAPRIAAFFAPHARIVRVRPLAHGPLCPPPPLAVRSRLYALFIPNRPPPRPFRYAP